MENKKEFKTILTATVVLFAFLLASPALLAAQEAQTVEIVVQFNTPPAVALRLADEGNLLRAFSDAAYEQRALAAHDSFRRQLNQLPVPLGAGSQFEIFSEHHRLFNGVFMRVPADMAEWIAYLPEVSSVTPNYEFLPMYEPFFVNPNLMGGARRPLNIDYIHNELGLTGAGVRVAVLDTGIYHDHPEFANFLDHTGRVPGWDFWYNYRPSHPHGTAVSGAVVGIAPGIELWHYRVAMTGGGGGGQAIAALEEAHANNMDIINISFGQIDGRTPFSHISSAVSLAVLDGTIVVVSAGNSGNLGASTIASPGDSPLAITVGAGTTNIWQFSSLGPVLPTYHIKPDVVAPGESLLTTTLGGNYAWFTGTSLSAPVITGIAAMLLEAFPDAPPYEIKARIMNTARPLEGLYPPSVFTEGAGLARPVEALAGQTVVTVSHYVPWGTENEFRQKTMSSFSFGGHLVSDGAFPVTRTETISANIRNFSNESHIYSLGYRFTNNPNSAATLNFNTKNIAVEPNAAGNFTVTMTIAAHAAGASYEGYIYVQREGITAARLPFAYVVEVGHGLQGFHEVAGSWYYFENGVPVTNEFRMNPADGGYRYLGENGRMVTNSVFMATKGALIDRFFWADENGVMQTAVFLSADPDGPYTIFGERYFRSDGAMALGWYHWGWVPPAGGEPIVKYLAIDGIWPPEYLERIALGYRPAWSLFDSNGILVDGWYAVYTGEPPAFSHWLLTEAGILVVGDYRYRNGVRYWHQPDSGAAGPYAPLMIYKQCGIIPP